jgi:hypothetical protein
MCVGLEEAGRQGVSFAVWKPRCAWSSGRAGAGLLGMFSASVLSVSGGVTECAVIICRVATELLAWR